MRLAAGAADQPALVDRVLASGIVRGARRQVDARRRGGVYGWGGWPPPHFRVVSARRLATRGDRWRPQLWQTHALVAVGLDVGGTAAVGTAARMQLALRRFRSVSTS